MSMSRIVLDFGFCDKKRTIAAIIHTPKVNNIFIFFILLSCPLLHNL